MMAEKKSDLIAHELVPEHTKLSDKDKKALYAKYNITLREIPKIFISDPAIAHLGAKEGDVIRIKRNSRTAGESVFYRGVIKE
ncbi:DNA-directed RNA polymerase subunit H [Candidatus Woesearchaeota archaeon]|nr:DNA-directed RNA polymerase subunit H [Candidatus Woesearchaeota archaeon]